MYLAVVILVSMMLVNLTACGSRDGDANPDGSKTVTQKPTTSPTVAEDPPQQTSPSVSDAADTLDDFFRAALSGDHQECDSAPATGVNDSEGKDIGPGLTKSNPDEVRGGGVIDCRAFVTALGSTPSCEATPAGPNGEVSRESKKTLDYSVEMHARKTQGSEILGEATTTVQVHFVKRDDTLLVDYFDPAAPEICGIVQAY